MSDVGEEGASGCPVRIVRVIARLNIGGPAIHVALLSAKLPRDRFETTLVTGTPGEHEGDMSDYAYSLGVRPIVMPGLGREISPLSDLLVTLRLWRMFRRTRPDIVHTHTAKAGVTGRLAARLAGVPIVVHTFHGHVLKGYFGRLTTRLFLATERFLGRRSDAIVTVSPAQREEIVSFGIAPPERVRVVRLGFDLSPFRDPERGRFRRFLRLADDVPLVGIVARLAGVKNHTLFLDAAARLVREIPGVHFAVVGDGELRKAIEERAARLGLARRVAFTGWYEPMSDVYSDLDVCVISSVNEGTPVTLIEAMAAGTPVVATAVGGVPDVVEDGATGRLVPSGDPAGLAGAIAGALAREGPEADATAKMSALARERVRATYTADRLVADTAALYEELLAEEGRDRVPL